MSPRWLPYAAKQSRMRSTCRRHHCMRRSYSGSRPRAAPPVGSSRCSNRSSGRVQVTVRGVVPADVVEHVVAAALSEALQRWTNERITPVNARLLADEQGIKVRVVSGDADPARLPDLSFEVIGGDDGPLSHQSPSSGTARMPRSWKSMDSRSTVRWLATS